MRAMLNRLQVESLPIRKPYWMTVKEYIVQYLLKFIEKTTRRGSLRFVITREYLSYGTQDGFKKPALEPFTIYNEFDRMSIPRRGLQYLESSTTAVKDLDWQPEDVIVAIGAAKHCLWSHETMTHFSYVIKHLESEIRRCPHSGICRRG